MEHVGRMGQSPFEPVEWDVTLDSGCGMSFSSVHKVRAEACRRLEEALLAPYAGREACKGDSHVCTPAPARAEATAPLARPCVCALVTTPACAAAALAAGATRVYAGADDLAEGAWPEGVIPWLDEVCREGDHARLDGWVRAGEPVAVGSVSELALAAERGALAEVRSCIPVHNESCLAALEDAGAAGVWLSPGAHARRGLRARPGGAGPRGALRPRPRARDDERALRAAGARPVRPRLPPPARCAAAGSPCATSTGASSPSART